MIDLREIPDECLLEAYEIAVSRFVCDGMNITANCSRVKTGGSGVWLIRDETIIAEMERRTAPDGELI